MAQLRFTRFFLVFVILFSASQAFSQQLDAIYVNPDMSLANYDRILLSDLNIASAKVVPPAWVEGKDRNPRRWAIKEQGIQAMQKAFREAVTEHLTANNGYEVVTTPADKTLEATVIIISLTPYALAEDNVVTKGTGELTMQVSLRDALTNKLLAIYEGPQQVGEAYQERTDLSALNDLKSLFDDWGKRIREAMDQAHQK